MRWVLLNFMRVPQAQVSLRVAEAIGETNTTQDLGRHGNTGVNAKRQTI